jgi:hypothetical protein
MCAASLSNRKTQVETPVRNTFETVEADREIRALVGATDTEGVTDLCEFSRYVLEDLAKRGEGPPRFPLTFDKNNKVTRWVYPLRELRRWQEKRLVEAGYRPVKTAPHRAEKESAA